MRILLVAATPMEIAPTLAWLAGSDDGHTEVESLISGIGMVSTTFHLTRHLTGAAAYDLVIQAGIGGAVDRELDIGTVVQVARDRSLTQGAEDRDGSWLSLAEIGFPTTAPYDADGWLDASPPAGIHIPYPKVTGGTTDRSSGSASTIARLRYYYPQVQTESMEGAAFHYVCRQVGVPFLQLRAISNYVEPRDRSSWQIGTAIHRLNGGVQEVIQSLLTI